MAGSDHIASQKMTERELKWKKIALTGTIFKQYQDWEITFKESEKVNKTWNS